MNILINGGQLPIRSCPPFAGNYDFRVMSLGKTMLKDIFGVDAEIIRDPRNRILLCGYFDKKPLERSRNCAVSRTIFVKE